MVQRPAISLGVPSRIVEVGSSSEDVIAFPENSSRQSKIMQARLGFSSSSSLKGFGIITLVEVRNVDLIWEIDIPEATHFLSFLWKLERVLHGWVHTPNQIFLCYLRVQLEQGSHVLQLRSLGLTFTQTWAFPSQPSKLLRANRTQALKYCES